MVGVSKAPTKSPTCRAALRLKTCAISGGVDSGPIPKTAASGRRAVSASGCMEKRLRVMPCVRKKAEGRRGVR
jgi:hypothetical protein